MTAFDSLRSLRTGAVVAACMLFGGASAAHAQMWYGGASGPRRGSVEISGGADWSQGYELGARTATLTRNPDTGPSPFELFTADTRIVAGPGGHGRVGVYLSRSISVEGGARYSRPLLETSLGNDAEGAESITASETVTRYVFEGAVLFHFGSGRAVPFVRAGGGYIRELHQENGLAETGQEIHAGGGVKLWLGGRRRAGVRVDAGVSLRERGVDFEEKRRMVPTAGVSFLYLF